MDIREWLQGVVAEEQRGRLEELAIPGFLHPRDIERDPLVKCRKFTHSSVSTFLDPVCPPSHGILAKGNSIKNPISLPSTTVASPSAISRCSQLEEDHNDDNEYTRKPRRKTRPDFYDPKPEQKEVDAQWQTNRKRKKKRSDGKIASKRKKPQPETARIKDFHAENVCNDRLTLRPLNDGGLFGKIKSSAVNRYYELPDLAFSQMKFLKRPEAHDDKIRIKADTRAREEESQASAVSPYFLQLKKYGTEANRSSGWKRPAAEGETSGKRGRTRTVNESIASSDASQTRRAPSSRPELQEDVKVPAKASSSYITWAKSGIQSSRHASFPKAPESIQVAAFQFKPGPFRSSSLGVLENSVNSTIQKAQSKKRLCSEDGNFGTLNLSGESPRTWNHQAFLSSNGAQHIDKRPHLSSSGAVNKIFGPQRDAQFLPYRDSGEPFEISQSDRATGSLNSHQNTMVESQQPNNNLKRTYRKMALKSSTSIERYLTLCRHAQQHAMRRVDFIDEERGTETTAAIQHFPPHKIYHESRDDVAVEVEEANDPECGNTESSYAYGGEANTPYEKHDEAFDQTMDVEALDTHDVEFDQTMDGQTLDTHDEHTMWNCPIDGEYLGETTVADGFYGECAVACKPDAMKRIDRECQTKLHGYRETSLGELPARFWRANKLY